MASAAPPTGPSQSGVSHIERRSVSNPGSHYWKSSALPTELRDGLYFGVPLPVFTIKRCWNKCKEAGSVTERPQSGHLSSISTVAKVVMHKAAGKYGSRRGSCPNSSLGATVREDCPPGLEQHRSTEGLLGPRSYITLLNLMVTTFSF